jgi:hypothetical protein
MTGPSRKTLPSVASVASLVVAGQSASDTGTSGSVAVGPSRIRCN